MQPEPPTLRTTRIHDVDIIDTLHALEKLRPEWTRLWSRCPSATPFQSPEWLIAWARRWATNSLYVMTVREDGALIGLAPFFIYEQRAPAGRTLVLLGNGLSDTLDLLAAPGCAHAVGLAVMTALEECGDAWDGCDWQQLRATSPLLVQPAPAAWKEFIELQDECPALALPDDRPIETVLSPHFAQRLAADFLRLQTVGNVRVERATPDNFSELFTSLTELHAARWASRNGPGVLVDSTVQAFHREAAEGLLARGVLRFYRLRVGGRIAAAYYGFLHNGRASYYLGGFDPAFGSHGVGNQIVWHALREAQREGAHTFDFLRGRERYKYRWGAVDVPTCRRRLVPSTDDR